MNKMFQIIPWMKRQTTMDELICRIAKRSQNAVWQRVEPSCLNMCPAEARGYIRVRAASVIGREMNVAMASKPELAREHSQILESSLDRVVRSILAHVRALHVQPVRARRAA